MTNWKRKRQSLYRRDGGICGICGEPVPFFLASIDHIRPRSKGGSNADFNLRITHRACNQERGAHFMCYDERHMYRHFRLTRYDRAERFLVLVDDMNKIRWIGEPRWRWKRRDNWVTSKDYWIRIGYDVEELGIAIPPRQAEADFSLSGGP